MNPRIYIVLILLLGIFSTYSQSISPSFEMNWNVLSSTSDLIPENRKTLLKELGKEIHWMLEKSDSADIVFICTHNSRRSQLSELWMRAAAHHYGIKNIQTYSGGTESTAFNPRMVAAIERFGFQVKRWDHRDNPDYSINLPNEELDQQKMFSKKFSDAFNPQSDFIAVMVCSDADARCPFVQGASARVALPFLDPKAFDNTPQETQAYDDKVREIGREIIFLVQYIKELN